MHKCTYRSNTITRIRKKKTINPKEEGERSIYSRGDEEDEWKEQPVMKNYTQQKKHRENNRGGGTRSKGR